MAILKMKRIRAAIPLKHRREALRALYRIGCVEVERMSQSPALIGCDALSTRTESTNADRHRLELKRAKSILAKYVPEGKKTFGGKVVLTESQLFDEKMMDKALTVAAGLNRLDNNLEELTKQQAATKAKQQFLTPWLTLDMPLEFKGTSTVDSAFGTFPAGTDMEIITKKIDEIGGGCCIELSRDKEQLYVWILANHSHTDQVMELVRQNSFAKEDFNGYKASAKVNLAKLEQDKVRMEQQYRETEAAIKATGNVHPLLEQGYDAYAQEENRDNLLSTLAYTKHTTFFEGWTAEKNVDLVSEILKNYQSAYAFSDPVEGDVPPTVLESGNVAQPLNAITEMYGMPKYDSIIDPNIAMLPFYVLFFGAIMSDFVYGALIFVGCLVGLKLLKPKSNTNMHNMLRLFTYCGVSTMIFGLLSGSYLGDIIFVITALFTGTGTTIPPLWFSPIDDPMKMLIFSLALGGIQLIVGMGIAGLRMIKRGKPWDALFDIGSWYVIFIGLGLMALQVSAWWLVAGFGLAMLLLTGGRGKKNIFARMFGGVGKLYDIVGYMSDILSYSRIMALGLSGAVVSSVVNKMGAMGGDGIIGILLLVFAAIVGHTFNIAISVLGAYVHTSRLQYIEYFGRFYEEGGRIMKPVKNESKYVKIE